MYNIETALPVIDLEALENHLAAKIAEDQSVSDKGNNIYSNKNRNFGRVFNGIHIQLIQEIRGIYHFELFYCLTTSEA